jgi:hypothetical protein
MLGKAFETNMELTKTDGNNVALMRGYTTNLHSQAIPNDGHFFAVN